MRAIRTRTSRRGSVVPLLLAVIFLAVAGYFGWREYDRRNKARQAREAEYYRQLAAREAREKAEAEAANRPKEQKREVVAENAPEEAKPAPPPRLSALKVWEQREAGRKKALAQVAAARQDPEAKPLTGFAGIRFGEPLAAGGAVRWGTVLDGDAGDSVASRGTAFAVYGPTLKKPFLSLGANPLVWVTPTTRRPYRIEFARPLALKPGELHEAETTNLVAFVASRFKREPIALLPIDPDVKGCEFVLPMGPSTIRVAEDGDRLVFSVEREDLRVEARTESEARRAAERQVAEADGKALDSRRYPHRPLDRTKYVGVKFRDETPRAFCGVVFATPPPESATLLVPMNGPKGFFLDYERAKCPPFRGFTRGRADIDSVRGGVYALTLFSAGGAEGLDDRDYFESVRATLSAHYKVEPAETKGADGDFPQLVYRIGELTLTFGPDVRGGFLLRAENEVLAALARETPPAAGAPTKKSRR